MDDRTHNSLLVLISEDRNEIRAARSSIVSYSATFVSAIFATVAASRGNDPIIGSQEAILLASGFLTIYLVISFVQYIGLRETRRALNRRETLLMNDDHAKGYIRVFYMHPGDYKQKKHLLSTNGDTWYVRMISGAATVSVAVILFVQFRG